MKLEQHFVVWTFLLALKNGFAGVVFLLFTTKLGRSAQLSVLRAGELVCAIDFYLVARNNSGSVDARYLICWGHDLNSPLHWTDNTRVRLSTKPFKCSFHLLSLASDFIKVAFARR